MSWIRPICMFLTLCLLRAIPAMSETSDPRETQVVTLDSVIRGQPVSPEETDHMNEEFDGHVGVRLHFPDELNEETGLMVVLHGWGGNYHQYDSSCIDWANRFNVITLQVNYRDSNDGSPIYDFGKYQAIDVLRAMKYVLSHYRTNDRRIIGWGGSGGGHVILQVGKMAPNTFSCIIECAGITRPTNSSDVEDGLYSTDRGWEAMALGKGVSYTTPEYQLRNHQYHADLYNARVLMFHGDDDKVVSVQHAYDMADALVEAGKEVQLRIVEGGGHAFAGAIDSSETSRLAVTNKYCSDVIETSQTNGLTDFDRKSVISIPTDDGIYYVRYDDPGGVTLRFDADKR